MSPYVVPNVGYLVVEGTDGTTISLIDQGGGVLYPPAIWQPPVALPPPPP